jgi:hypothetical protein
MYNERGRTAKSVFNFDLKKSPVLFETFMQAQNITYYKGKYEKTMILLLTKK